jgi:hypothetical protein
MFDQDIEELRQELSEAADNANNDLEGYLAVASELKLAETLKWIYSQDSTVVDIALATGQLEPLEAALETGTGVTTWAQYHQLSDALDQLKNTIDGNLCRPQTRC